MKKNIFAIIGSASANSSNRRLMERIAELAEADFKINIFDALSELPHFDPELSIHQPPREIQKFRAEILNADGIIICTPEYVFSIPSRLKNAIEWCVATTVFSEKPLGIITASSHGLKGHEELKLIMKTIEARFTDQTTLLIQGIKGKIEGKRNLFDLKTEESLIKFIESFKDLLKDTARLHGLRAG
ncbi:MAG: NADPH-dependent FMN reductase [Chitinophagales bacterium]